LDIEEPILGWNFSAFHFHPTLAGMYGATLIGHQVIEMRKLALIMVSATPVPMGEAKAPQHLRQEAFEDSGVMLSGHKWLTR
jgi:hypothetical protein